MAWVRAVCIDTCNGLLVAYQQVLTHCVVSTIDFRVKSALSMSRKVVSKLRSEDVAETDTEAIEAAVWCEQRQALRYTVVCGADSYTEDVLAVLAKLQAPDLGFEQEFVCKSMTSLTRIHCLPRSSAHTAVCLCRQLLARFGAV